MTKPQMTGQQEKTSTLDDITKAAANFAHSYKCPDTLNLRFLYQNDFGDEIITAFRANWFKNGKISKSIFLVVNKQRLNISCQAY